VLQIVFEIGQTGRPTARVLAHPPVVDQLDWNRVQEVQLLSATPLGDDQPSILQQLEVLGQTDTAHREPPHQRVQRLPVLTEQHIEQFTSRRVGQRLEHRIHVPHYRKPYGFLSSEDLCRRA
jgi:hypothetical protein